MKICIIGANGMVGKKLVKKILSSDLYQTQINKICLFDISLKQTKDSIHLTHIKGNIEDLTQIKKLASERFDIIFHLAAQPSVLKSYEEPIETFSVLFVLGVMSKLPST